MAASIHQQPTSLLLTPQVLEKIEMIQQQPQQSMTMRLTPSKSTENKPQAQFVHPEKSTSLTLAERRNNIPASLKISLKSASEAVELDKGIPSSQISDRYVRQCVDKQQKRLKSDPKSIHMNTAIVTPQSTPSWVKSFVKNATMVQERVQLLEKALSKDGIPSSWRGIIWQALVTAPNHLTIMYPQLLKETCAFATMIDKDVEQCKDKEAVARILKAYSIYDGCVGYCPGMSYIVSVILSTMPENEAFGVFVRLLETYDMRTLFMLNMEGLQATLDQFQTLLTLTCPQLDAHLKRLLIHPSLYATQWYLSLFASSISSEKHLMRIYDIALLEGTTETVTRVALLLLQKNEKALLSMTQYDQVLGFLTTDKIYTQIYSGEDAHIFARDMISLSNLVFNQVTNPVTAAAQNQQEKNNRALLAFHFKNNKMQQQQQIEETLTQLEKENAALKQETKSLKLHDMDQEAAQSKLAKRNAVLEKRIKKYKVKLANATTGESGTDVALNTSNNNHSNSEDEVPADKRQEQYCSFVASLRDTGDFGALIAGALAPKLVSSDSEVTVDEETSEADDENQKKLDTSLQNVTSELVAVKLQNFETSQRYESLYHHCEDLTSQLHSMQEAHTGLLQKVIYLESELEDVQTERDQIFQDQEEVLAMAMVAKKTAAELQLEKMALAKEVERLEQDKKELQEEKQAFFMPRGTFSEEVFAAHSILFGSNGSTKKTAPATPTTKETRRHTLQLGYNKPVLDEEYKNKFVESELRCRELEKYLAETKVRLAEFESTVGMGSNCSVISPRASLNQQRRASCYNNKRSSTASLSMLANRVSSPTSPRERRLSTESYASSTMSMTSLSSSSYNTSSKRSSVYSRIWNAFGAPTTPVNPVAPVSMKEEGVLMCEEPQIIQQ